MLSSVIHKLIVLPYRHLTVSTQILIQVIAVIVNGTSLAFGGEILTGLSLWGDHIGQVQLERVVKDDKLWSILDIQGSSLLGLVLEEEIVVDTEDTVFA
jgi:hypothetical protein